MKLNLPNSPRAARATCLAAILACATCVVRADVEDKITKSFSVAPGGQLLVELDRGSVDVKTADREAVEIEVTRKAGGREAAAKAILADHEVTATQEGNKVLLKAKFNGAKASGWFGKSPELQVKVSIVIPRQFDVNLQTAGGHISVVELTGKSEVRTSGGHINFEKITGPISAGTSGGHIRVATAKGNIDIHTSGGHIDLSNIEGDVVAKTSGGAIHAEKITGRSTLKTSGGSIAISGLKGAVDAGTSGGGIDADLLEQPAGDCSLKTSGGGITVALVEGVAVDVDLRTSGGRVSTDWPVSTVVQGERIKNELHGKINGGGPLITAHTSGGSVRVRKK